MRRLSFEDSDRPSKMSKEEVQPETNDYFPLEQTVDLLLEVIMSFLLHSDVVNLLVTSKALFTMVSMILSRRHFVLKLVFKYRIRDHTMQSFDIGATGMVSFLGHFETIYFLKKEKALGYFSGRCSNRPMHIWFEDGGAFPNEGSITADFERNGLITNEAPELIQFYQSFTNVHSVYCSGHSVDFPLAPLRHLSCKEEVQRLFLYGKFNPAPFCETVSQFTGLKQFFMDVDFKAGGVIEYGEDYMIDLPLFPNMKEFIVSCTTNAFTQYFDVELPLDCELVFLSKEDNHEICEHVCRDLKDQQRVMSSRIVDVSYENRSLLTSVGHRTRTFDQVIVVLKNEPGVFKYNPIGFLA